jgi:hypothetical protein
VFAAPFQHISGCTIYTSVFLNTGDAGLNPHGAWICGFFSPCVLKRDAPREGLPRTLFPSVKLPGHKTGHSFLYWRG